MEGSGAPSIGRASVGDAAFPPFAVLLPEDRSVSVGEAAFPSEKQGCSLHRKGFRRRRSVSVGDAAFPSETQGRSRQKPYEVPERNGSEEVGKIRVNNYYYLLHLF